MKHSIEEIYTWLEQVKDPEIPVLSLVDLGVISEVVSSEQAVKITLTPTFVGCPAIDMMKKEINDLLVSKGISHVEINISYHRPWTSDNISDKGREALKRFGFAPPPKGIVTDLDLLEHEAVCPRCNGTHTETRSHFGPTLCRSIHYCFECKEAFEQFKHL